METKQLAFFKRAAELEHFTKAANDLYVSQPFLSRTIANLEEELGVKLFDHVGRGVVLNPCGQAFYKWVVKFFNEAEEARRELWTISKKLTAQLTLVTNVGLYLPGLFSIMSHREGGLNITQYSARRSQIIRMLLDGRVDFALCCPLIDEEPEIQSVPLHRERGVIIYPPGHWLSGRKRVSVAELRNEAFISVTSGFGVREVTDDFFRRAGMNPNIIIESADTGSVLKFVKSGLGIAVAPYYLIRLDEDFKDSYVELEEHMEG
ncbi:MAG: LysR family transcriptional regulator, partial [Oscillospiraceae bacterium]